MVTACIYLVCSSVLPYHHHYYFHPYSMRLIPSVTMMELVTGSESDYWLFLCLLSSIKDVRGKTTIHSLGLDLIYYNTAVRRRDRSDVLTSIQTRSRYRYSTSSLRISSRLVVLFLLFSLCDSMPFLSLLICFGCLYRVRYILCRV